MSKFVKVVSKVLKIDQKKVKDQTSPMNVASWDSFRGLLLITELEKTYKFKFSMDEVLSIKNIGDIKSIIKKHNLDPEK